MEWTSRLHGASLHHDLRAWDYPDPTGRGPEASGLAERAQAPWLGVAAAVPRTGLPHCAAEGDVWRQDEADWQSKSDEHP